MHIAIWTLLSSLDTKNQKSESLQASHTTASWLRPQRAYPHPVVVKVSRYIVVSVQMSSLGSISEFAGNVSSIDPTDLIS